jgi:hypothetical protein
MRRAGADADEPGAADVLVTLAARLRATSGRLGHAAAPFCLLAVATLAVLMFAAAYGWRALCDRVTGSDEEST